MTRSRLLVAMAALFLVATQTTHNKFSGVVQCTSYLDDYFLPTAKIALNKLQQSLSPSSQPPSASSPATTNTESSNNNQTTASVEPATSNYDLTPHSAAAGTTTTSVLQREAATQAGAPPKSLPAGDDMGPSANEFIKLEPTSERPAAANSDASSGGLQAVAGIAESASASSGAISQNAAPATATDSSSVAISSSSADFATDSDPSSTVPSEMSSSSSEPSGVDARKPEAATPATADNQQQQQVGQTTSGSAPAVVTAVESKSPDEAAAIKETELEAVAAVDASIGFGMDIGFGAMSDTCYDEYANARYCEPEFENIAFERQVEVSSECGSPPSRFCTAYLNERHEQIRNCHICDAQHPKKRHPAAYLTDMNNSNSPTCWVSAPINAAAAPTTNSSSSSSSSPSSSESSMAPAAAAAAATQSRGADNVTLVLNLDKKYEIVYISMQFCSMKPDSLAIYKSTDYGRSWIPYQFYSSQCHRMYGRHSRAVQQAAGRDQLEAACANSTAASGQQQSSSGRIAFSTLDGRSVNGGSNLDRSQMLQDWITATNIRIVLDRHQASWIHANLVHPHAHYLHGQHQQQQQQRPLAPQAAKNESEPLAAETAASQVESSLTSPSDTFNYAMSDLTVGGRCKCNGHASRCIHTKEGRLQCDCRHNTAGRDCEKCAPFHFDRPWARATQLDANPCQPCNCNGHSRKCRFDAELYRMSGKRSGGVCIQCRDNTAGRFCNYCKEGYTRDHSKPMSDKEACKHCDCHPIGSLGRACNQTTGQCPCKEGVSGLQCNRCAPGYQQSSSLTDPCIKLPDNENDINYDPPLAVDVDEQAYSVGGEQGSEANPVEAAAAAGGGDQPPQLDSETGAPPGGSLHNYKNNNKLEPQATADEPAMDLSAAGAPVVVASGDGSNSPLDTQVHNLSPDKDYDSSSDAVDSTEQRPRHTFALPKHSRPTPLNGPHWQHPGIRSKEYYGYHPMPARTRHQQPAFDRHTGSSEEDEEPSIDDDDDLGASRRVARPLAASDDDYLAGRGYYYSNVYSKPRYTSVDYKQRRPHQASAGRHRNPPQELMPQPVASVEHGDEMNSLDDAANYALPPPIYSSNDDAFNQIQAPNLRRNLAHRGRQLAAGRARGGQFAAGQIEQPMMGGSSAQSEVVCGDCQSSTRRLSSRQFCHLQFAIKATILNRYMADDWTKIELEIQDIFKSPSGGGANPISEPAALATARAGLINTNRIGSMEDMIQADEPTRIRTIMDNATVAMSSEGIMDLAAYATRRIKVGTIQSIWVPTEDLYCKCPRLKAHATYLLMGSIDAKENSANALQLDRHGVALEWKPNLQEKLMRYQRRLSRGKCL